MAPATKCDVSLLLVGKTGNGKSSTGNNILNLKWDPFQVDSTDTSVTSTFQFEYSRYQKQTIKVMDMPGLSDSSKNVAEDISDVVKEATTAVYETPDGYDAVLVVVRFGRQSLEDKKTIDSLKGIFGEQFFSKNGILVVTHGDNFERTAGTTQTFADYCSAQKGLLNELWKECSKRVVLFDNVTEIEEEKKAQRKELFDLVDSMKGVSRYTPEIFKAAKSKRDELIAESEELVLTDEIKSTLRLMMHDLDSVEFETPAESIAQLKEIKARAQRFIAKTEAQDRKVKKMKAVLAMAESIKKATESKMKLASLMMLPPASGEVSLENAKEELETQKQIVERNKKNLNRQYEELLQEDISTKVIIASAALVVLGIALPVAVGAVGGAIVGVIAGVSGKAVLPYVLKGMGYALKVIPFSELPGVENLKKTVKSKTENCTVL